MSSKLSKSDKTKSKFTQLNINHVYKGNTTESHHRPAVRQYGMQVVGKLQGTRRLPPPAWVPSLKAETGGLDPRVALVPPGGSGWGAPYSGNTSAETDPTQANNGLSPALDSLANTTAYSSMNGAIARETIGTSFEPAFARHSFANAPKMTTEPAAGAEPMSRLFSGHSLYGARVETTVAKPDDTKVSTAAVAEDNLPTTSTATTEAPTSAWSQRSQATVASGGLAANKPFCQRPAPVTAVPVAVTTCEKVCAESSTVNSNISDTSLGKPTGWASVAKEEEPNFDEHILFSDEEDTQDESRDAAINTTQLNKEPAQEVLHSDDNSGVTSSTETSAWIPSARCSSNMADSCGMSANARLFPRVPLNAWSTSDPNKLIDNPGCPSVARHLPFGLPSTSVTGLVADYDGGRIPLDAQFLTNTSSVHAPTSYKDPYFPQMVSPRLMDRSVPNRLIETGMLSGETEAELQNVQRLARTQEFKSAVERAQQARAARHKTDVFISDQNIQPLHPCGINASDPSSGLNYCQPFPPSLQSTPPMVPRETIPNVTPLLNSSITAPHLLLSAYQHAAATGNVLPDLATAMANAAAAMALTGGTSTSSRFPGPVPFVAPATAPMASISCTGTGPWPSPLTSAIVSAATAAGMLNSRTQGILDTLSASTGSASNTAQISTPVSHPSAIILNPDFFMERFLEIINQQQKTHASQASEQLKTVQDAVSTVSQSSGVSMTDDMLGGSHQQQHKCNGNSTVSEFGFRADHFASACIEDGSSQVDSSLKTKIGTSSPDLSAANPEAVRNGPQLDLDKSASKLGKRVPGLMDVKVPKSTTCNLAHIWDQDDYLIPTGSRAVSSRGRGRSLTSERGRGIVSRRRGGNFRSGDSVTTAPLAHSSRLPYTAKALSDDPTPEDQGASKAPHTVNTSTTRLPSDFNDSSGDDNAVDGVDFTEAVSSRQRTYTKTNGSASTGDMLAGGSRRYRGHGEQHDVDYSSYDRYARGRASHRAALRGGASSHFTHHSFSSRNTAGGYSTRYIRQFGGGSFSSRGYRQHTSGSDQPSVSNSGSVAQGGHKDARPLRTEPPTTSRHGDTGNVNSRPSQSDRPRRPFTHRRTQALRGDVTGRMDHHYSDGEEPNYHRQTRDHRGFMFALPRNRSHEGPRYDSSKDTGRKHATQVPESGDLSELSRIEEVTTPTKSIRPATVELPIVDYEDSDVPTVRVPAPEPKLPSNYRQQYSYSRGGGHFRSDNYYRRSANTGATGHRSSGRANSQQQTKRAGATGNFQSSRRYRELRDRHRDDGRDGDGGGAAAGGGSRTATSNVNGTGASATNDGGGGGRSGTTAPSGGVGGSRDADALASQCQPVELTKQENWLASDTNVDVSRIGSNENNMMHSAGTRGSHVNRRYQTGCETSQTYRQSRVAAQKRNHPVHRPQNIPPLMSIKPSGPFARSPDRFDAVLTAGCCVSSSVVSAPKSLSLDTASVKSEELLGTKAEATSSDRGAELGTKIIEDGDSYEKDTSSFLSDGFTEVVSKASKRLARLRLQQEAAAAAADNNKSFASRRHPDEPQKQQGNRLSSHTSTKSAHGQHQRRQEASPIVSKTPGLKPKSPSSIVVPNKYTTQRSNKLLHIKPTFMGPPLSSVTSNNPSGSKITENIIDYAPSLNPIQVSNSHHSAWVNQNRATAASEPRTWSKVVGARSTSATAASVSSERKHLVTICENIDSPSSVNTQHGNNRPMCDAPTYSSTDGTTDSHGGSGLLHDRNFSATVSHGLGDSDTVTRTAEVKAEETESIVLDKRQICTVSATSVYPVIASTTQSNASENIGILSTPTVSCSPTVANTVTPNPVVVVVPVSSNNICKVRPQQQQSRRSPTQSISATSAGVPLTSQSLSTSVITNVSVSETNAASVTADSVCQDIDRDYNVDLALTLSGVSSTGVAALHDQTVRPGWSTDGIRLPLLVNGSNTAAYYNKINAPQTAEVSARSFWPSEQQPQVTDFIQHVSGREVNTQNSQYAVHQQHQSDHAALGLLPTGVTDFTGNKVSGMSSARHNLYTLQSNYAAQSLPAPAMESYSPGAAAFTGGSGSTFGEFACKLPPSHLGSPTQQPALGSNSLYVAPSMLHSSTSMGGLNQQTLSSYPVTTTSWTTLPPNNAHPSQLHPTQRLRHRPTHHSALEPSASFNGFSFQPDPQNDYAFLQSGVQPPSSGLYSTLQAHPHSAYVPPISRSWSLLGTPTVGSGGSVIAGQDYHHHSSIAAVAASLTGTNGSAVGANAGSGTLGGSGAAGLLPLPITHTGGGRNSADYASFVAPHVASSTGNGGFTSSLVSNYVGVIGCGRPTASASAATALAPHGDHLNMSLRHRGTVGNQQGFYAPLHATGGSAIGGLTDTPTSVHNNQMAASQQPFPVHSSFYTSSSQQHQSLQQQLSQFAAGNQSAAVARATGNPVPHPHHGLVGGPQAAATGLYAAFGTPPNQPTPPPLPAHPGPAPIAPAALRHHVEGWHWWG